MRLFLLAFFANSSILLFALLLSPQPILRIHMEPAIRGCSLTLEYWQLSSCHKKGETGVCLFHGSDKGCKKNTTVLSTLH